MVEQQDAPWVFGNLTTVGGFRDLFSKTGLLCCAVVCAGTDVVLYVCLLC